MATLCPDCGQEIPEGGARCPLCSTLDSDPKRDARLGRTVAGRYRLVKKLGRGGMGVVYLAEHQGVGQKVAIKFLHANWSADEEVVRRFRNEARTYGQINHPNAVQLHDFGEDDSGSLFISMEFVEGLDLKRTLERDGRLSPRDALDVALQCCEVLGVAHAQGIVHRDLKPENIMLTPKLRGFHAKVLDFGLAHLAGSGTRLTAPGMVCGTPRYMAPEQAEGTAIDARVDIYALGLVLFEALSGKMPFDAPSIAETLRRQLSTPLPHLSESAPDLAQLTRLDAAIQKATAKKPADRFASMEEFARELTAEADALPRGESVKAAAPGSSEKKSRRGIAIGVAGAVVLAALATVAAIALDGPSASALRRPIDELYAANREPLPPVACREGAKNRLKKLAAAAPHLRDSIADSARVQEGAAALAALEGIGEGSAESAYFVARARVQAAQPSGAALTTACACPGFAAAENLAGNVALLEHRAEEAEQHYLKAGFAKSQLNLALARFQQHKPDDALRLLADLVAAQPDYAEAQQALAVIHAALGHTDEAQQAWCRARDLGLAKAAEHCPR